MRSHFPPAAVLHLFHGCNHRASSTSSGYRQSTNLTIRSLCMNQDECPWRNQHLGQAMNNHPIDVRDRCRSAQGGACGPRPVSVERGWVLGLLVARPRVVHGQHQIGDNLTGPLVELLGVIVGDGTGGGALFGQRNEPVECGGELLIEHRVRA
jgi:hypothetical protein